MIEKIVGWAIDHKAIAGAIFALLCVAGVISWNALSIDAYPDISDTTVQVVTQVPGLATEEIEQQISIPVERAVSGIPNLITMRSKNSFGISTVILVFDDGALGIGRQVGGEFLKTLHHDTLRPRHECRQKHQSQ